MKKKNFKTKENSVSNNGSNSKSVSQIAISSAAFELFKRIENNRKFAL